MVLTADSVAGTVVGVVGLLVVIVATVVAQRLPAVVVAAPIAGLLIALGLVDVRDAADEITTMAPTIGFLAAMLVIADASARAGVFTWIGSILAHWSRSSPHRLLRIVFLAAAATTAVLSLDTTIVLLTPVAVATARRIGARVTPVAFANAHLANTASTLMPVSNLTNLLAFSATGLSFLGFTGVMLAPWVAAIVVEYLIFRLYFADSLARRAPGSPADEQPAVEDPPRPTLMLVMLGLLLVAFVVTEPLGVPLAAVAGVGAAAFTVPRLLDAPLPTLRNTATALNIPFLGFVAVLGVVILPVRTGPIGDWIGGLIPGESTLLALLAVAALAAVLANLVNNLPATLLLIPLVAHDPGLVLAMLLGVNLGPNLAYFGSLANLLWRDIMRRDSTGGGRGSPTSREYLRLGALTVPATLVVAVVALWAVLRLTSVA
ncbi:SLC13 family permease [Gordonia terrae]|uniref:Arsenic transporter n=2 Tax=Gordonia terrae TaxID=2055 RepID=A0AAD0NYE6_9ACTN|nr:SLC13 family permease [Gordonia terrae]VTR09518.1 arsenical pump family protein [Clostridioides difficile]ANY22147.1 arsenic transporter [Gordonia terrae]AWO82884.1 arsenic transporter [Gordonia terrae]VTS28394.1 Arsenic efflux pump protein [Gordonia terrae]GAB43850.1 putative arsenite resistance pump [Gordonia terrae NBRC 100016]